MLAPGLVVEKFTIKRVHDGQRIIAVICFKLNIAMCNTFKSFSQKQFFCVKLQSMCFYCRNIRAGAQVSESQNGELSVAGNIYVLYVVQIVLSLENGNLRDTGAV